MFIWSEQEEGTTATWGAGGATRVWLHHALESLDKELRSKHGSGVVFASGDRLSTLLELSRTLVRSLKWFLACRITAAKVVARSWA